jgi:hypothetical protein
MTIPEIEAKYGAVEIIKAYEQVLEDQVGLSQGLVLSKSENRKDLANVFDATFKTTRASETHDGL